MSCTLYHISGVQSNLHTSYFEKDIWQSSACSWLLLGKVTGICVNLLLDRIGTQLQSTIFSEPHCTARPPAPPLCHLSVPSVRSSPSALSAVERATPYVSVALRRLNCFVCIASAAAIARWIRDSVSKGINADCSFGSNSS